MPECMAGTEVCCSYYFLIIFLWSGANGANWFDYIFPWSLQRAVDNLIRLLLLCKENIEILTNNISYVASEGS